MPAKDYILQIKVKNGPMLRAMRAAGYETVAEMCRATGVTPTEAGKLLNLKEAPQNNAGEWRPSVIRISKALHTLPEDLFPPQHFTAPLQKNTGEIEASIEDVAAYLPAQSDPQELIEAKERTALLSEALTRLPARTERILRRRFGLDGEEGSTCADIGKDFDRSVARIVQIEMRGLRELRHVMDSDKRFMNIIEGRGGKKYRGWEEDHWKRRNRDAQKDDR